MMIVIFLMFGAFWPKIFFFREGDALVAPVTDM
jgi:hypothetical protein